jgi:hypothetical protein
MPLMTVVMGPFGSGQPRDRFEVVLNAAVHGWMEGHLAAPGHVVSGDRSGIDMPTPPFPARESEQLRALVSETMARFQDGEEPAAAMFAAAIAWQAGRQEGSRCPGCALEHADQPIPRAVRGGQGRYSFQLDDRHAPTLGQHPATDR